MMNFGHVLEFVIDLLLMNSELCFFQWCEDLCFIGFAIFNTVWATLYLKFWKRSSTEFCYRWGTLEQKDDMLKDPRPLFNVSILKNLFSNISLAYT